MITKSIYEEKISMYRSLCLTGVVSYALFGLFFNYYYPEIYDSFFQRMLICFPLGMIALLSWRVTFFKRHLITSIYIAAWLVTIQYFFFSYMNNLKHENLSGLLVLAGMVSLVFENKKVLVVYSVSLICMTMPLLIIETEASSLSLLFGVITISILVILNQSFKGKLIDKLNENEVELKKHLQSHQLLSKQKQDLYDKLHRSKKLVQEVLEITSSKIGGDFFKTLVKTTCEVLGAHITYIGRFDEKTQSMQTIAAAKDHELMSNFQIPLAGSHLEKIRGKNIYYYETSVAKVFNNDSFLKSNKIEGMIIKPLINSRFELLGVLVLMSQKPLNNIQFMLELIDTFALRTISELEREFNQKVIDMQRVKLIESSKLASLGEMAGGIAHEINSPLAIISGTAEILEHQVNSKGVDKEMLLKKIQVLKETSIRIAKIVNSLQVISQVEEGENFYPVALGEILNNVLKVTHEKFKANNIQFDLKAVEELTILNCNKIQIAQVLINVLTNALHALKDVKNPKILISSHTTQKATYVTISDNGHGIDKEVAEKIMNPFFTTKTVGAGAGLGLSISKSIMQSHNGDLTFESKEGMTSFNLIFYKTKAMELLADEPYRKSS